MMGGPVEWTMIAGAAGMLLVAIMTVMAFETGRRHRNMPAASAWWNVQERLESKRQELRDAEAELRRVKAQITERDKIEAEIAWLEDRLAEHRAVWNGLDDQRRELAELTRKTEEAALRFAEAERDILSLEQRATAAREAAQGAEERAARAAERLVTAETTGAAAEERGREASEALRRLEAELGPLREEAASARALAGRADELRAEVERLTTAEAGARERVEALKAQHAEYEVRQAALLGEIGRAEAERAALARDAAARREKMTELTDGIAGAHARLAAIEERAATARTELEDAERRVAEGPAAGDGPAGASPRDPLEDLRVPVTAIDALRVPANDAVEDEADAIVRLRLHVAAAGLSYPDRTLKAFHTAMKVGETSQLTVLAGISGTGKSQLPRVYAAAMGIGFLTLPVQPRWDSPQDLMGFYNYVESRYRATDLARALHTMEKDGLRDRMLLVLLDEMNLARVEYYFADFLSRLENRPAPNDVNADWQKAEIELDVPTTGGEPPPRVRPGYNVLFAGTMNEDESTQSLSDKVLDRANVLRFASPRRFVATKTTRSIDPPPPLSYERWRGWQDAPSEDATAVASIERMQGAMHKMGRPFGYRLRRAMLAYVANYPGTGMDALHTALADQVEMRLLPKLRGVEMEEGAVGTALDELTALVRDELRDVALAEAIAASRDRSDAEGGRFAWHGVTRA